MKHYFKLQYKMLNRRFKDNGFDPLIAYFILIFGFVVLSIYLFSKTEFAKYIFILTAMTLIGKLSETRRAEFLESCFGNIKMKKIRVMENLILALPFLFFLLYKQLFISIILLVLLATILALVNFRTIIYFTLWTPFSNRPFEFTTGYRNTFYLYFLAYALAGIAVYVNNFNLGIFSMLLVFITALSYYTNPENEYYVWSYNVNAKQFLYGKIKTAILFSSALALPIAIVMAIFYPQNIGILAICFLIGLGFLVSIIVSKYSVYPNDMNIIHGILLALCIWFPPILIVLIPYLFKESETRLSSLLK
jgi:hypothetical protein